MRGPVVLEPAWLTLLGAVACSTPTQTVVRLDADEGTRAVAYAARVRVCDDEGALVLDRQVDVFGDDRDAAFPLTVPLEPRGEDASRRFELLAELLDDDGVAVTSERVLGGYREGELREVERTFEVDCLEVLDCGPLETCTAGACADARAPGAGEGQVSCAELLPTRYPRLYTWIRQRDFTAGQNPDDDSLGGEPWSYEWIGGGGDLASEQPWFETDALPMAWDTEFLAGGAGARAVFASPAASAAVESPFLSQQLWDNGAGERAAPLVRWRNPTGQALLLRVAGTLALSPTETPEGYAEVVLQHWHASERSRTTLLEERVPLAGGRQELPVAPLELEIARDDELRVSFRATEQLAQGWAYLYDELELTLVSVRP